MAINTNNSVNSYLLNMLYSGGGANRAKNSTVTANTLAQDLNQLSMARTNAADATAQFRAQQAGYKNQISGFSSAVTALQTEAQQFTGKSSVFNKKYVTDESKAVSGTAASGATAATYDVSVQKLAVAQRNDGKSVDANGYGAVASGAYTLGLTVGTGQEKQLTVNISGTDTNKQALSKIADAINNSSSGVKAGVKTANDKVYLSIESQNTGAANSFTLRDVSNNVAASLNLTNKIQTAQDAAYTVNGVNQQAASNTVKLDNGNVNLTLKAVTAGTDKVTVGADSSKTANAVRDLVATYNEINYNIQNSDNVTKRGQKMLSSIQNQFAGARREEYQNIGITMNRQTGDLNVDTAKLTKAIADNPTGVERLLSGGNGLAAAAGKIAQTAQNTPASAYFKAPNISDYLNYSANLGVANNSNSYLQGLFLDMMI